MKEIKPATYICLTIIALAIAVFFAFAALSCDATFEKPSETSQTIETYGCLGDPALKHDVSYQYLYYSDNRHEKNYQCITCGYTQSSEIANCSYIVQRTDLFYEDHECGNDCDCVYEVCEFCGQSR